MEKLANVGRLSLCLVLGLMMGACGGDLDDVGLNNEKADSPSWIYSRISEDDTSFFFVGQGSSHSAAGAEVQALADAQELAANFLSLPLDTVQSFSLSVASFLDVSNPPLYQRFVQIELNKAYIPYTICSDESCPDWTSSRIAESFTAYAFVGIGAATSPTEAEALALANAQQMFVAAFSVSDETVSFYSTRLNTYFSHDEQEDLYLSYVQLELNKAFLEQAQEN